MVGKNEKRASAGGGHVTAIDTFRALAIVSVILFHYFKEFYPDSASVLLFGWNGVDLFFVISGFVLYLQFERRYLKNGRVEYGAYFRNRFLRIAPAFYVSLLAEIVFFHPDKLLSWTMAAHLTFTHIMSYDIVFSIQPIYWTLGVEVQFYLFLVLAGRTFRGRSGYVSIVLTIVLSFLYRFVISAWFGFSHEGNLLINQLPGRLPEFCAGILIARLFLKKDAPGKLLQGAGTKLLFLASGMILYAILARLWLRGRDGIFDEALILTVFHPLLGLSFSLMMIPLMSLRQPFSVIMRLRPVVFVGVISYSVYLWHVFIIEFLNNYFHFRDAALRASLKMTLALALTAGFSTLSYFLIEKTFLRLKSRA